MRLEPYPSLAQRRRKVLKHVFDFTERWWEVLHAGDLLAWHRRFETLRVAGCIAEGWQRALENAEALAVLDEAHAQWLSAAERACDEALAAQRVFPEGERHCFVGEWGVTVFVATDPPAPGDDWQTSHLVTCYRPACCVGVGLDEVEATVRAEALARNKSGYFARASVRRRLR